MRLMLMGFFLCVLAACSVKSTVTSDTPPGEQPHQAPTNGSGALELQAPKSTGAIDARFVYCKSQELEAGLDFIDRPLGTQIDIFKSRVGHRLPGATTPFSLHQIESISSSTFAGTVSFGIVVRSTTGKLFVYSVKTQDYKTAQLNYSDWDRTFEQKAECLIYQTNPFRGTNVWP